MQVKIELEETVYTGPSVSSGPQFKNCVSGFGYLSEPDKCTDKQLLRDKANVMLKHFPKQT